MRYLLTLVIFFVLPPAIAQEQTLTLPLQVAATCDNNPRCELTENHPLLINVHVTNQNEQDVECAFTLVEKMGPSTRLLDKLSGRTIKLPTSLPPRRENITLTRLRPGEAWKTYVIIYPEERRRLGHGPAGFHARIAVSVNGRDIYTDQQVDCSGETTLEIGKPPEQ